MDINNGNKEGRMIKGGMRYPYKRAGLLFLTSIASMLLGGSIVHAIYQPMKKDKKDPA